MNQALFELRGASLSGEVTVLRSSSWRVAATGVTAIVGPAGTGKSVLLGALAGVVPPSFQRGGQWLAYGRPLDEPGALALTHVPQRTHRDTAIDRSVVDRALGADRPLLLDEPESYATPVDRPALAGAIRERTQPTVMVSHDLDLVQMAADRVMLLCAGSIVVDATTADFFERPSTELVARFVREGNCWPRATPPALPSSFHWVLPGRLAGTGRPGLLREVDEDLAAIASAGIGVLASLTEEPFPPARLRAFGIEGMHLPVRDMDVPPLGRAADLCRRIERAIAGGAAVALHCHAGLGRTGTMLAAFLVWSGDDAATAIARVRAVERGMIQTAAQERFVASFAEMFGRPS